MEGTYDAVGHRTLQAKGVADRKNAVADANLVAVADLDRRKWVPDVDFEDREIEIEPFAEQARICGGPVLQGHRDFVGILDHMPVGDDDAARIDDRAGAD